ncbi:MAG: tRNA preQ1(34) S-adenosylmethionine ribosyltransferase-isomerase QueA [Candidatus Goldbacteria bacterium]|nr:tRNA preQ1(34) S-adenosylmethionine ribosyltransferase-isomerase QueA [Candidatus Goldiibacteriota bacterium]
MENYDYYLPKELIALEPIKKRDNSRLLVFDRSSGKISHDFFYNVYKYFNKDDVLVLNNTQVIPARIFGKKADTNAKIEILLLKNIDEKRWNVLVKNSRRVKENDVIIINNDVNLKIIGKIGKEVIVEFNLSYNDLINILWKIGVMPIPPYIKKNNLDPIHRLRYQTIYAKIPGSKAAPTAGLHFTKELLEKLQNNGIKITEITLHIGLGTFNPVDTVDIRNYKIHTEQYYIPPVTGKIINKAKKANNKIIACGTTSLRAIESANKNGMVSSTMESTSLYIYPGFKFSVSDYLITNFHLPKSSLYILVCAFGGIQNIKRCYDEAIKKRYKFYSYGDVMLIK